MTTVKTYFTQLPELTPRARELQLSIEFWMNQYQEARVLSSAAWDRYAAAVDANDDYKSIAGYGAMCETMESVAIETWGKWQRAKAELLAFYN